MPKGVEHTDHDGLFKKLLRTFFLEFVEVFLPEMAKYLERDSLEFLDKEVFPELDDKTSRRADLVVKARFRGQELFFLIHIESQAARRPRFNRRMFFYTAWLDKTFDLPVYPIALLTYDSPCNPEPDSYQIDSPDRRVLDFRFRTIQLNRLPWRDYLRHHNPLATTLMAKMDIPPEEQPQVKIEMLRLFSTMKLNHEKMTLIGHFIESYLKLTPEQDRQVQKAIEGFAPKKRKVVMEHMSIWKRAGYEEGVQQGEQRGTANTVLHLLNLRIGSVGLKTQNQIKKLSQPKLWALSEALLQFSKRSDLTEWLKNNG